MQAWPCFIRLYPSVPVTGTLYFLCWGSEWISAVPLGRPLPSVSRSWIHFSSGSMTLKEPRLWSWSGRLDFCTAAPLKRSPSFFSQNETLMSGGEARTFSLSLLESSGGSSSYWDLSGVTTKWRKRTDLALLLCFQALFWNFCGLLLHPRWNTFWDLGGAVGPDPAAAPLSTPRPVCEVEISVSCQPPLGSLLGDGPHSPRKQPFARFQSSIFTQYGCINFTVDTDFIAKV